MRRRSRALAGAVLGAALAFTTSPPASGAAEPPPNVLLITVDTLRADALGWVAGQNPTPAIDALAAASFRFPRAVSPVPLTLPAHTSLLSGLLPLHHGVHDNGQVVPAGVPLLQEALRSRGYATAAFVSGYPLRRPFGLDRGFDRYDDTLPVGQEGWLERPAPQTTAAALAWVAALPTGKPWFLWIHYYDAHDPYTPPREFLRPGRRGLYDGEVGYVDAAIGTLRAGLPAGDRTLTILTADHGESLGEHGEFGHGFFLYEPTIRIPVLMHWPGKVPAGQSDLPVRLIDIEPTLRGLIGLAPVPADGQSFGELLHGRSYVAPAAHVETEEPWIGYGWAPLAAVIEGDWKLIRAPRPELYDLAKDPRETSNLVDADRRRSTRLRQRLTGLEAGASPTAAAVDDPEALEQLHSLGYIGGGRRPTTPPPPGLADPKDRLLQKDTLSAGEQLLRAGDFAGAALRFEAVLRDQPGDRYATLRLGMTRLKAGQLPAAVDLLRRAVANDPGQAEAHYALADALTRLGRLEEAVFEWQETARLQPRRIAAWSNLGTTYARLGRFEKAAIALRRSVAVEPENPAVRDNLALVLVAWAGAEVTAGRSESARKLIGEAISLAPNTRARIAAIPTLAPLLAPID